MIDQSFEQLIASIAAKTPTPGGGAVAAMSACLGASLFLMVVRFSRGKKATLEFDDQLKAVEDKLEAHLQILLPMAERDCESFDHVSTAYRLPKATEEEKAIRKEAVQKSMLGAMVVPEETLCKVRDVFGAIVSVLTLIGKNIASDLGSGANLLVASAESAHLNVRINAAYLDEADARAAALDRSASVLGEINDFYAAFNSRVEKLIG